MLLFAFPATTAWSNLPTQPAFTITMLRAASMLTLGNRQAKNLPVAAPIHCTVPLADQNTPVRIAPPPPGARKETKPEVTSEGRASVDFTDTEDLVSSRWIK